MTASRWWVWDERGTLAEGTGQSLATVTGGRPVVSILLVHEEANRNDPDEFTAEWLQGAEAYWHDPNTREVMGGAIPTGRAGLTSIRGAIASRAVTEKIASDADTLLFPSGILTKPGARPSR